MASSPQGLEWSYPGFVESVHLTQRCGGLVVVVDCLVFDRGAHPEAAVTALPVVEDLEVLEDGVGELDPGRLCVYEQARRSPSQRTAKRLWRWFRSLDTAGWGTRARREAPGLALASGVSDPMTGPSMASELFVITRSTAESASTKMIAG